MATIKLSYRHNGKPYDSELCYGPETRTLFREDVRVYFRRLREERSGRIAGDAPILLRVAIDRKF